MTRDECWMTFSEALERYLKAREELYRAASPRLIAQAKEQMEEAAEHMDALTEVQS